MKLYLLGALLLLQLATYAQKTPDEQMAPGMPLPAKAYEYLEQQTKWVKSDDLKEKLVILAFVSRSCYGSIESISQLQALQKSFDKRVQVILVTRDESLILKNGVKGADLPLITGDSYLKDLFPYRTVPTHVWIDKGIVRYVAGGHNLTVGNINKVLRGEPIGAAWKRDIPDFDYLAPLAGKGAERLAEHMIHYSVLLKNINGVRSTYYSRIDSSSNRVMVKVINQGLPRIYSMSFGNTFSDGHEISRDRIIYKVKDTTAFLRPADPALWDHWDESHNYSYELSTPLAGNNWQKMMREDIARYFPFDARIEKVPVTCYVLKKKGHIKTMQNKKGKKIIRFGNGTIQLKNAPINDLASVLESKELGLEKFVVDKTGVSQLVDMEISYVPGNLAVLRAALKKYHLQLVEKVIPLEMLVIRDGPTSFSF